MLTQCIQAEYIAGPKLFLFSFPEWPHTFWFSFHPLKAILHANITSPPAVVQTPPNTHVLVYPAASSIAPSIGAPTSTPTPTIAKHMPMRVPISPRFFVMCTIIVGGNETNVPEKKPNSATMAMRVAPLLAAMRHSIKTPESMADGIKQFNGPTRTAAILGNSRPKALAAFKILRR